MYIKYLYYKRKENVETLRIDSLASFNFIESNGLWNWKL